MAGGFGGRLFGGDRSAGSWRSPPGSWLCVSEFLGTVSEGEGVRGGKLDVGDLVQVHDVRLGLGGECL